MTNKKGDNAGYDNSIGADKVGDSDSNFGSHNDKDSDEIVKTLY